MPGRQVSTISEEESVLETEMQVYHNQTTTDMINMNNIARGQDCVLIAARQNNMSLHRRLENDQRCRRKIRKRECHRRQRERIFLEGGRLYQNVRYQKVSEKKCKSDSHICKSISPFKGTQIHENKGNYFRKACKCAPAQLLEASRIHLKREVRDII